jgi:diguanylate cyclase (GGDEF)-like protein/PAS domain S-box-containing protein
MWRNWKEAQKVAFRIVLFYIFISFLWVILTDIVLKNQLGYLPHWIGTIKGWFFIIVSGLLFYKLIQKEIRAIVQADYKYRLVVENVSDLILVTDKCGIIKYGSPSFETIAGFTPNEYNEKSVFNFINQADISKLEETFCIRRTQENDVNLQFYLKHKNGPSILIEGKAVPIYGDTSEVEHIVFLGQDITERNIAETKLFESEERYRKLVEYSPETTLIHVNGEIAFVNKAGLWLMGADNFNQIVGRNILEFVSHEYLEYAKSQMKKVQAGVNEISNYNIYRLDGTPLIVEILAFQTTFQGENAVQIIVRDVTEKKKAEEQIQYLAYYDPLTDIPNRNLLYKQLDEAVDRCKVNNQAFAVMFLDLDRFKKINDTWGHSFGDLLLKQVTSRLKKCLSDTDKLFRYGGDEYVIVLEQTVPSMVSQLAENIIDALSSPFFISERPMFISTSIGICEYPKDGDNVEALLQHADMAMYQAKENGKNNYRNYSASLKLINNRKMEIENGIREAIENEGFALSYQPQIELNSRKIVGLEALIRWKHPKFGFVSPEEFIPVAEETGLIVPVGNWVLKTACRQFKKWLDMGIPQQSIAVNVSAIQFQDINFVKTVEQILHDTKLDSSYLELEITESVTQQVEEATKIMKKLKSLGVNLSIDDFGTGYSSLNYLRHFPFDKLKIDKSFVDEINHYSNGEVLAKTIIDLGNSLGFQIIAEGVENEHQVSFLKENNCHLGQGYLFSKPLPTKELENLLKNK